MSTKLRIRGLFGTPLGFQKGSLRSVRYAHLIVNCIKFGQRAKAHCPNVFSLIDIFNFYTKFQLRIKKYLLTRILLTISSLPESVFCWHIFLIVSLSFVYKNQKI